MRYKYLAAGLLFSQLTFNTASASVSETLKETNVLMKGKEYKKAQQLILSELKINRNEYRLWLALGYVFESEGSYEKALKAFYHARDLKTGLEGMSERISRLEALLQEKDTLSPGETPEKHKAMKLLEKAKYNISLKKFEEGYLTFLEAIEIDRSVLSQDQGIVQNGVDFFANQAKKTTNPEDTFYLGSFQFYAGDYVSAKQTLESYLGKTKKSPNNSMAKNLLDEMKQFQAQILAAKQEEKKPTKVDLPVKVDPKVNTQEKKPVAKENLEKNEGYVPPSYNDEYADLSADQLYEEAMACASTRPGKAIKLLTRSINSGSESNDSLLMLGDLYSSRQGFAKEAIASYRAVISRDPDSEAAIQAKEKIAKLNPSNEQRAKEVFDYFKSKQ